MVLLESPPTPRRLCPPLAVALAVAVLELNGYSGAMVAGKKSDIDRDYADEIAAATGHHPLAPLAAQPPWKATQEAAGNAIYCDQAIRLPGEFMVVYGGAPQPLDGDVLIRVTEVSPPRWTAVCLLVSYDKGEMLRLVVDVPGDYPVGRWSEVKELAWDFSGAMPSVQYQLVFIPDKWGRAHADD